MQHREDREQQDQHAVDEIRRPVRQVTLQERLARLVVALRLLGHRHVLPARIRKGSGLGEPGVAAVDGDGRVEQQVRQRRVDFVAGQEVGRHGDDRDVAGRQIRLDVDDAARHRQRRELAVTLRVGRRMHQAHERQIAPAQEVGEDRRLDPGNQEHRIDRRGRPAPSGGPRRRCATASNCGHRCRSRAAGAAPATACRCRRHPPPAAFP